MQLVAVRPSEVVVRLVEQDLVRQPGPAPQRRRAAAAACAGTRSSHDARSSTRSMMTLTSGWRSARASSRARGGGSSPPERDDARQRFERAVVAFGIDDADTVALQDQLLAEQAGQPRFPGAGFAGDEDRPAANGQADRLAVVLVAEQSGDGVPSASPTTAAAAQTRRM